MNIKAIMLFALSAPILAGCVDAVKYTPPVAEVPLTFDGAAADTAAPMAGNWWLAFKDARLDALVTRALSQNLDVLTAVERIKEAEAGAGQATGALFPSLAASAFDGRLDNGPPAGMVDSRSRTLDAGWTIDLFGANRATRKAALSQLEAAKFGAEAAKILVSGAVAQSYIDLRFYQESIALTQASLTSRKKTRDLIQSSFDSGAATKVDLLQADQLVLQAEAELPTLEVGYVTALNRLATLTGQSTAALADLAHGAAIPAPRFKVSAGVPADVIRLRPDVMAAERALSAATARVGVARAALLPSITLGGRVTQANVAGTDTKTWSFGPTVNLPFFTGGALRAGVKGAEAQAQQAYLAWQAEVRGAVEEVQVALASYSRAGRSLSTSERLVQVSAETVELSRSTFDLGEGSFLTVLDAERTLLQARAGAAAAKRGRALSFVQLSVATASQVSAN